MKRQVAEPLAYDGALINHPEGPGGLSDEDLVTRLRHLGGAVVELARADPDGAVRSPEMNKRRRAIETNLETISCRLREEAARYIAMIENARVRADNLQAYRELLAGEFGRYEQQFHREGGQGSLIELAENRELATFVGDYVKSWVQQRVQEKSAEEIDRIRGWQANVDSRYADYVSGHPKQTPQDELRSSARLDLLQAAYSLNGRDCPKQHPFIKLAGAYIEADHQLLKGIEIARSSATTPHIGLEKLEYALTPEEEADTLYKLFRRLLRIV